MPVKAEALRHLAELAERLEDMIGRTSQYPKLSSITQKLQAARADIDAAVHDMTKPA